MEQCKTTLRELFDERSINVSAFCEKNGISKQAVYAVLNGKVANPGVSMFKHIADGLGMTMNELYATMFGNEG